MRDALVLLAHSKGELVEAARDRGLARLRARLLHEVDEQRGALLRPLSESEQRLVALRRCLADAAQALKELGHRFAAEQADLSRQGRALRQAFLERVLPEADDELDRMIDS